MESKNGEYLMENKWTMEHREMEGKWRVKMTTSRKWCFSWHRAMAMSFPAKHLGENLGSKIWWGTVSGSKVTYIAEVSKAGEPSQWACPTREKGFWSTPSWGAWVTNPHGPVSIFWSRPNSWRNHSLESINYKINFWTVTETLNKRNNNWRDSQSVHSQEKPTPRVWVLVCLKSLASGGLVEVECASVSFFPPTAVELGRDLRDGHVHTGIPQPLGLSTS